MAESFKKCLVETCSRNAHYSARGNRGYCTPHYYRLMAHGHPLLGGTPRGEPRKFFDEQVCGYQGDDCLKWPYGGNTAGYGQISAKGEKRIVSRMACESRHGPPPTKNHEASHICGNGHLGCVNPNHLVWKTPIENQADKLVHGTDSRGQKHGMSKLTNDQAAHIKRLIIASEMSLSQIARDYGVSVCTIWDIKHQKSWRHLHVS